MPLRGPFFFLDYLLRANFGGSDSAAIADGGDVETASSGSVQDGTLTAYDNGAGDNTVTSNRLRLDAASAWCYSQSFSSAFGMALIGTVKIPVSSTGAGMLAFADAVSESLNDLGPFHYWTGSSVYYIFSRDGAGSDYYSINMGTYSTATDIKVAIVLGGYSSGQVPWDGASAGSGYLNGAAFFKHDGSNWQLVYRGEAANIATYYAAMYSAPAATGEYSEYDDIKIPDADLSSLLAPLVLDTFTDSNGTALTSHTPDVDTVGGGWSTDTEGTDIHEIQSNMVRADGSTDRVYSTIDTGKSDVFVEALCDAPLSGGGGVGVVVLRYQDINNLWQFSGFDNDAILYERVSGSFTPRGGTGVIDSGTLLRVVCTCDDETIKCYVSDTEEVSYTSAANFKTETSHGVRSSSQGDVDNFAVYPIGNGGEYSAIGNY